MNLNLNTPDASDINSNPVLDKPICHYNYNYIYGNMLLNFAKNIRYVYSSNTYRLSFFCKFNFMLALMKFV